MKLWAFGTSNDGLGLSELDFWLLTYREFTALQRQWERARGIKPPLTSEEKQNLANNERYIREAWMRAHNKVKERAIASGLTVVKSIPVRKEG